MSYLFINIETERLFECGEKEWLYALETAGNEGWKPDGTHYDFFYEVDEYCDFEADLMYSTFIMLTIRNEQLEWDGSYTAKKNQVVNYEDAVYLAAALRGTDVAAELIDFIEAGSFRIYEQ